MCCRRLALLASGLIAACSTQQASAPDTVTAGLPAGPGRDILARECLNCHELDALELFRGFYTRDRWRSLIVTMRDNGAEVDEHELDVLAAYLAVHFGTGE